MTAAARSYAPKLITPAQNRAIWAAARSKGIDPHELIGGRSIRELSTREASALLDRLNGKPAGSKPPHRSRAPKDVTRLISAEQVTLIDKLRIAMGWNEAELGVFMDARRYPSDPRRKMSVMTSSPDAVAVIELLKKVVAKRLHGHGVKLGRRKAGEASTKEIPAMLRALPPHDALKALFAARCAEWRARNADGDWSAWADTEQLASGRRTSCPTTCAEMARLIERMEAERVTADAAADQSADEGNDPPAVLARIGGAQ